MVRRQEAVNSTSPCGDRYCRLYTYCRLRQYMPVLAAHIVALKHILPPGWNFYPTYIVVGENACQIVLRILSPHNVKTFKEDNWVDFILTEGERERERESINIYIKLKMLKFQICVHPNVDGPSRYYHNQIGVYRKKCYCLFIMSG